MIYSKINIDLNKFSGTDLKDSLLKSSAGNSPSKFAAELEMDDEEDAMSDKKQSVLQIRARQIL